MGDVMGKEMFGFLSVGYEKESSLEFWVATDDHTEVGERTVWGEDDGDAGSFVGCGFCCR